MTSTTCLYVLVGINLVATFANAWTSMVMEREVQEIGYRLDRLEGKQRANS